MRNTEESSAGAGGMQDTRALTLDDYVALPRTSAVAAAPDGTWLAVAVQTLHSDGSKFVSHLWRIPVDGSAPVQLTRGDLKNTSPAFRHDGALMFLSNRKPVSGPPDDEADKRMQVWMLPASGGEPVQVTDEPLGVEAFRCAAQAEALAIIAPVLPGVPHADQRKAAAERAKKGPSALHYRSQPVRFWDHWMHDSSSGPRAHLIVHGADGGRRDLTPDADYELAIEPHLDLAPDGRSVVVTWASIGRDRIPDSAIALFDVGRGVRVWTATCGPRSTLEQPVFSPDGRSIAAMRAQRVDGRAPTLRIVTIDAASGAVSDAAPAWDAWPVAVHGWTRDGTRILVGADARGRTRAFAIDPEARTAEEWLGDGSWSSVVAVDRSRLAGVRMTARTAPEIAIADAAPGGAWRAVSSFAVHDALPEVEVEEFDVRSSDGTPIHTFLVKPKGAVGPLPIVMFIHGGPISAFGDQWHWRWNAALVASRGYAVVMPNARGSTGYGQAFIEGVWGNSWGAQCYRDLMAVADAMAARPDLDAKRFCAMGGSFGGYMTNWIGSQTDRFTCLITHASIYAMSGFTGTTDVPAFWLYEMGADPDTPLDEFDRYSPARFVSNWKTPVLILHGEKDYRCPIGESLNLFEALQQRGVESELIVFPDENHWIMRPRNIVAWYDAVLAFLDRHLHG